MNIVYDIGDALNMMIKMAPYLEHLTICEGFEENGIPCTCGVNRVRQEAKKLALAINDQLNNS